MGYLSRGGHSAGPGSTWKISSFLQAFKTLENGTDLDDMYPVQDMRWGEFAVATELRIHRWSELQQMTLPNLYQREFNDTQSLSGIGNPFSNLRCLSCLDTCKTRCGCAPPYSLSQGLTYLGGLLQAPIDDHHHHSLHARQRVVWARPCGKCISQDNCWGACKLDCIMKDCPAVVRPHKGTTLDCIDSTSHHP